MSGNPFTMLEFTPRLVRLLREKPERLLQVAANHRKWLLAGVHPDRGILGDVEQAKQFTAALEELKNPEIRARAMEEFLASDENVREVHASEVRQLRSQLERATEEQATLRRDIEGLRSQAVSKERVFQSTLMDWMKYSLVPPQQIVVRRGETESVVSLNGTMLVTTTVHTSYSHIVVVGENRRVCYVRETPSVTMGGYTKQSHEFRPERNKRDLFLFGMYVGHQRGSGSHVDLTTATEVELAKLGLEMRPYIQIGRPVVVFDRRPDGVKYLWFQGVLREIKEGTISVMGAKHKWSPAVTGKAQQK